MRRTRLVFFSIIGIAAVIVLSGRWASLNQAKDSVTATVTSKLLPATPGPSPVVQRAAAQLPEIRSVPSEVPLAAEVRDVMPVYTSIGSVYFVGEIINTGQRAIAKPEMIISLLDASGKRIAFETGYTIHDAVFPGEKVPVQVLFTDPPNWTSFEVFLQAKAATGREYMAYTAFEAEEDTLSKGEYSYYEVTGVVSNTGTIKSEFVQAVVSLYGQDGKLVGMASTYADESKLDPGDSSPFTVRVVNVMAPAVSYRLQFVAHAKPTTSLLFPSNEPTR